jgi:hypothetical protein
MREGPLHLGRPLFYAKGAERKMKASNRICLTFSAVFALGIAACQGPVPTVSPIASPLNSPISTPKIGVVAVSQVTGPDFALDQSLLPGDTTVTGSGPIDLPIVIVDVTMMAKPLGTGTIGRDGRFSISLNGPIIENHTIGIQIGAAFQATQENMKQLWDRQGTGFKDYPEIGVVFDSVVVHKPQ